MGSVVRGAPRSGAKGHRCAPAQRLRAPGFRRPFVPSRGQVLPGFLLLKKLRRLFHLHGQSFRASRSLQPLFPWLRGRVSPSSVPADSTASQALKGRASTTQEPFHSSWLASYRAVATKLPGCYECQALAEVSPHSLWWLLHLKADHREGWKQLEDLGVGGAGGGERGQHIGKGNLTK